MKIELKDISFNYGETKVLENFTLTINHNEMVAVLGHNGSGKSTLAKLIMGLLEPNHGHIYINDSEMTEKNVDELRKHLGIIFQNPDNQFIGTTVEDDIAFGLENRCVPQNEMQGIIEEFASKVGMIDFLKQEPSNLSGGQKQRVAIAGALALNPDLLILDEATSMLDPKGKNEIMKVILDIKKNNPNMAILSITHHIDEALLADEIIVLNKGKVVSVGNPKEILYNNNLLKENNLLPPFVVEVLESLKEQGINIEECFTMEELVSKL